MTLPTNSDGGKQSLSDQSVRIFHWAGRLSNGRRYSGTLTAENPKAVVDHLMARKFVNASVFEQRADGARFEVGGISQSRKGARRLEWFEHVGTVTV